MADKINGEAFAKRYSATCPYCEKEIHVQRSLGMVAFGMTMGFGTCPHCGMKVRLDYDPEGDTLSAMRDKHTDLFNEEVKPDAKA